jgi:hypothetical protein
LKKSKIKTQNIFWFTIQNKNTTKVTQEHKPYKMMIPELNNEEEMNTDQPMDYPMPSSEQTEAPLIEQSVDCSPTEQNTQTEESTQANKPTANEEEVYQGVEFDEEEETVRTVDAEEDVTGTIVMDDDYEDVDPPNDNAKNHTESVGTKSNGFSTNGKRKGVPIVDLSEQYSPAKKICVHHADVLPPNNKMFMCIGSENALREEDYVFRIVFSSPTTFYKWLCNISSVFENCTIQVQPGINSSMRIREANVQKNIYAEAVCSCEVIYPIEQSDEPIFFGVNADQLKKKMNDLKNMSQLSIYKLKNKNNLITFEMKTSENHCMSITMNDIHNEANESPIGAIDFESSYMIEMKLGQLKSVFACCGPEHLELKIQIFASSDNEDMFLCIKSKAGSSEVCDSYRLEKRKSNFIEIRDDDETGKKFENGIKVSMNSTSVGDRTIAECSPKYSGSFSLGTIKNITSKMSDKCFFNIQENDLDNMKQSPMIIQHYIDDGTFLRYLIAHCNGNDEN